MSRASAAGQGSSAAANVGSCTSGGGAAKAGGGAGDKRLALDVGCVAGQAGTGGTAAGATIGSCPGSAGGGTLSIHDGGVRSAGLAGEEAERTALRGRGAPAADSGRAAGETRSVRRALSGVASGRLPFAGLPLWSAVLFGLTAILIGAGLRSRSRHIEEAPAVQRR